MAASRSLVGKGAKFYVGDGGGTEVFTQIAEVHDASPFERIRQLVEVTHLTSDDGYRERKPGMKDVSPLTLNGNWIPGNATHAEATGGLPDDFEDGTLRNFRAEWFDEDGAEVVQMDFAAYVEKWSVGPTSMDGPVSFSCTLQPQGKPTLTVA